MRFPLGLGLLISALSFGAPALGQDLDDAIAKVEAQERARIKVIDQVSKAFVAIGGGSGVIISKDGYILTNHHVAGSRKVGAKWVVTRPGGVFEKAEIVGHDALGDITLLKLSKGPYPFVPMGDSDAIQVGQAVIALGNPFGFSKDGSPNVTVGLISAMHRYQGGYSDAIQTDTAINPGNSGGPLIDMQGRLLGINGRIGVRFGTRANTGVGYAIPVNQIKLFIPEFKEEGVVYHGEVKGLRLDVTESGDKGALVRSVRSGSSAKEAGFQPNDLIVAVDGRRVHNPRRFLGIIGTYPAGATVTVKVKRGGDVEELEVTLVSKNATQAGTGAKGKGYVGVRLSTHIDGGVEVEEVIAGSPAHKADLRSGDLIKAVSGKAVKNLNQFKARLATRRAGQKVSFKVIRGGKEIEVDVTLGKLE